MVEVSPRKQKRADRIYALYQADRLLEDYCKHCPFLDSQRNCDGCPIEAEMKGYRQNLGWSDDGSRPWSKFEDSVLITNYRIRTAPAIAKEIDRTPSAIYARADYLRKKGLL